MTLCSREQTAGHLVRISWWASATTTVLDHLSWTSNAARSSALSAVPAAANPFCCAPSSVFCRSGRARSRFWASTGTATEKERRALERRWGVLFQQGALFSSLTVRQNVQFPMRENLEISQTGCWTRWRWPSSTMVGLTPTRRREISIGVVGRHDQARGARARAGARSGDRLSRRAYLRPRSDLCRRLRRADPDPAADAWASPCSWSPTTSKACTPCAIASRHSPTEDDRLGPMDDHARVAPSLGAGLLSGQARRACVDRSTEHVT